MRAPLIHNKKGLSLVETIVALSILALVFAGTTTLIITVLNLAMITRDKTEATAAAQDGLAKGVAQIQSCADETAPPRYNVNGKDVEIVYERTFTSIGTNQNLISDTEFIKVIVTVDWTYRNVAQIVKLEQYVRNE